MPTRPEDDYTGDDCECPLCKSGVPKARMIPAELPDGRRVTIRMSDKGYQKLQRLIEQRS